MKIKKPVFIVSDKNTCPTIREYDGKEIVSISPGNSTANTHTLYYLKNMDEGFGTYPFEKVRIRIYFR